MRKLKQHLSLALIVAAGTLAATGWAADTPAPTYFQVDLSKQVTHSLYEPMLKTPGSDLAALATGTAPDQTPRKTLKGIPFRLDGVVLVGPGESSSGPTGEPAPVVKKVEGIPVGRKAEKLYFLQATHWHAMEGARLGTYVVHYADGSKEEIPIRYGQDVRDWWDSGDDKGKSISEGETAWTGTCEAATQNGNGIRLFLKTWTNPHPERGIQTLDMVTGDQKSGPGAPTPFLVALSGQ
jgi:hypothetical protein